MNVIESLLNSNGARGAVSRDWGARNADHRVALRRAMGAALNAPAPVDLAQLPYINGFSLSVSHAPTLGGWVAVPLPTKVGLDIEHAPRVSAAVAARVEAPGDAAAPSPAAAWVAKEALFKAFVGDGQPRTLSEIRISSWTAADELQRTWTFTGHGAGGWVVVDGDVIVALAIVSK